MTLFEDGFFHFFMKEHDIWKRLLYLVKSSLLKELMSGVAKSHLQPKPKKQKTRPPHGRYKWWVCFFVLFGGFGFCYLEMDLEECYGILGFFVCFEMVPDECYDISVWECSIGVHCFCAGCALLFAHGGPRFYFLGGELYLLLFSSTCLQIVICDFLGGQLCFRLFFPKVYRRLSQKGTLVPKGTLVS